MEDIDIFFPLSGQVARIKYSRDNIYFRVLAYILGQTGVILVSIVSLYYVQFEGLPKS